MIKTAPTQGALFYAQKRKDEATSRTCKAFGKGKVKSANIILYYIITKKENRANYNREIGEKNRLPKFLIYPYYLEI